MVTRKGDLFGLGSTIISNNNNDNNEMLLTHPTRETKRFVHRAIAVASAPKRGEMRVLDHVILPDTLAVRAPSLGWYAESTPVHVLPRCCSLQ